MTHSPSPQRVPLIELIAERQRLAKQTDAQVTAALGFSNEAVFRQIKSGQMKLPVSKLPQLAKAIDYPAADLLHLALAECMPDLLKTIERCWGHTGLSAAERTLLKHFRDQAERAPHVSVVIGGVELSLDDIALDESHP